MKTISILGSTGSIGTQTLEVIRNCGGYKVAGLCCGRNVDLLFEQAKEFRPEVIGISDEDSAAKFIDRISYEIPDYDPEIFIGETAPSAIATIESVDVVLGAMVGVSGLKPVIDAIECGKDIALANKETLVAGGDIVMPLSRKKNIRILPVDSEHSAIWQCLWGQPEGSLDRILITASGGPFRGYTREMLGNVTLENALAHPTWKMGGKVTIDSSTMMNKGLEIIEASHLFDISVDNIDVVVHPQSVIHSMIRLKDGSVLAQMGKPNMMMPIEVALFYPDRGPGFMEKFDPFAQGMNELQFMKCDTNVFGLLELTYHAGRTKGLLPAVMNGANEVAVNAFLNNKIKYLDIEKIVSTVMNEYEKNNTSLKAGSLEDVLNADKEARRLAYEIMGIGD
ncbi:MAG: 1-deoxy-D-xylulose-5-phosphate reductoisomerase [Clostridiales bacterium]|nr:1-deoxy-D-xylulose-5-phosphate reductoisomerase [Clostridiales bacterium]